MNNADPVTDPVERREMIMEGLDEMARRILERKSSMETVEQKANGDYLMTRMDDDGVVSLKRMTVKGMTPKLFMCFAYNFCKYIP